jgi:hypothetical protein
MAFLSLGPMVEEATRGIAFAAASSSHAKRGRCLDSSLRFEQRLTPGRQSHPVTRCRRLTRVLENAHEAETLINKGSGRDLALSVAHRVTTRKMVGATGFEPATSWSQTARSTKPSYAPMYLPALAVARSCQEWRPRKPSLPLLSDGQACDDILHRFDGGLHRIDIVGDLFASSQHDNPIHHWKGLLQNRGSGSKNYGWGDENRHFCEWRPAAKGVGIALIAHRFPRFARRVALRV